MEESDEVSVLDCLRTLGIVRLAEWDAMVFLYRHAASLGTAAKIARLIGHDKAEIGTALSSLEVLGLIKRSHASKNVRFYRFEMPPEPSRRSCLMKLLSLGDSRVGRLLLLKHLKTASQSSARERGRGLRLA